jgi:hypothetical protein
MYMGETAERSDGIFAVQFSQKLKSQRFAPASIPAATVPAS